MVSSTTAKKSPSPRLSVPHEPWVFPAKITLPSAPDAIACSSSFQCESPVSAEPPCDVHTPGLAQHTGCSVFNSFSSSLPRSIPEYTALCMQRGYARLYEYVPLCKSRLLSIMSLRTRTFRQRSKTFDAEMGSVYRR